MEFAGKPEPNLHSPQKSVIVSRLTITEQNHDKIGRKKLPEPLITYIFLILDLGFQTNVI